MQGWKVLRHYCATVEWHLSLDHDSIAPATSKYEEYFAFPFNECCILNFWGWYPYFLSDRIDKELFGIMKNDKKQDFIH